MRFGGSACSAGAAPCITKEPELLHELAIGVPETNLCTLMSWSKRLSVWRLARYWRKKGGSPSAPRPAAWTIVASGEVKVR